LHPQLLKEYAEFCDIREEKERQSNIINFHDEIDFHPVKLLPLCDFLATTNKDLVFDHISLSPIAIIPRDQQQADATFEYICKLHKNDQNACGGIETFKYVMSELIDNIYEHSNFTRAFAMIKKHRSEDFVDVCIFDNGITIPKGMFQYGFRFAFHSESIIEAINGLSTKIEPGRGTGLGSTIRILLEGLDSQIFLVSGKGAVYLDKYSRIRYNLTHKMKLDGTLIGMRVPYPSPVINIYNYI
jgi:hypothetical protein